jgi:hypothetical protein
MPTILANALLKMPQQQVGILQEYCCEMAIEGN